MECHVLGGEREIERDRETRTGERSLSRVECGVRDSLSGSERSEKSRFRTSAKVPGSVPELPLRETEREPLFIPLY